MSNGYFIPTRVLMTTDTIGGVWTYTMELCRGLKARGVEVVLATMGAPMKPEQRQEVGELENVTVAESQFKLEWMDSPWSDVTAAGEWLLALESSYAPDVVHLNGYAHGNLPFNAPVVVVGHSCVFSWWQAVKREAVPVSWSDYQRRVREGLQAAHAVVVPSAWMGEQLERHYGITREIEVISNGRALPTSGVSNKENLILSVGRLWDDGKNARTLAAAAASLTWPVWFAGDDRAPGGQSVQFENVRLLGSQAPQAVAALLQRASIYALPARYEPFGLSVLEAALSGCALVLGDIPSLREVWGDAALYVPPDRADVLASTLKALMQNHERLDDLAQAARRRAGFYTVERMTAAYLNLYGRLRQASLTEPADTFATIA